MNKIFRGLSAEWPYTNKMRKTQKKKKNAISHVHHRPDEHKYAIIIPIYKYVNLYTSN